MKRMLPGIEFEQVISTIETISAKTEDRQMYNEREKAQRDHEWALSGARDEGLEKGRAEGREEGREEGLEKGREEGLEKGKLAGKIQTLQELLGEAVSSYAELVSQDRDALTRQLVGLQQRLRNRES